MRILKPIGEEIEFDEKARHLLFNVNVIDEIQDHFDMHIIDALNLMFSADKNEYDTIAYILTVLLNEDVRLHNKNFPTEQWENITEEFIKEEVLTNGTGKIISILIVKAFNGDLPKSEEDDPNAKSGKAKK